jgi:hypothetical protein
MENPMIRAEIAHTVSFPEYRTVHTHGELSINALLNET